MALHSHKKPPVTKKKAKAILKDGKVRGKTLSPKKKKLFGAASKGKSKR